MDRKEVFAMLRAVAAECYQIGVARNWWKDKDTNPNKRPEQVMLMVSELGEMLNAHRKNHYFPVSERQVGGSAWDRSEIIKILDGTTPREPDSYINIFDMFCKNCIEDEMADTIIRILSYVGGWNCELRDPEYRKESTKNFGHDLLRINWYVLEAYHGDVGDYLSLGRDWGKVLKALIVFCDWWKIDIIPHVKWKMKYLELKTSNDGKSY